MLPYLPQTLEVMRSRLPKAIKELINPKECVRTGYYPSKERVHVFDWEDGLRLIVTRELQQFGQWEQCLHLSASFPPESPMHTFYAEANGMGKDAWIRCVQQRISDLFCVDKPAPEPLIWTEKCPHWFIPCKEVEAHECN